MERNDGVMVREDFLEYAQDCGLEAAYGLVLLAGPDGIEGGWPVYQELLERFGTEDTEKPKRPANVNGICERCVTDCPGTTSDVWTGCVYRQTKEVRKL